MTKAFLKKIEKSTTSFSSSFLVPQSATEERGGRNMGDTLEQSF